MPQAVTEKAETWLSEIQGACLQLISWLRPQAASWTQAFLDKNPEYRGALGNVDPLVLPLLPAFGLGLLASQAMMVLSFFGSLITLAICISCSPVRLCCGRRRREVRTDKASEQGATESPLSSPEKTPKASASVQKAKKTGK